MANDDYNFDKIDTIIEKQYGSLESLIELPVVPSGYDFWHRDTVLSDPLRWYSILKASDHNVLLIE